MYAYICMYTVYMFLHMYTYIYTTIRMHIIQSFILLVFTYVFINRPTHFSAY